jgi:peptide/nickel transport system substrate-binding protein
VLFWAALSGCSATGENGPVQAPVLTIGVPEGLVNGRDLGIGSLIRQSTLEGLTQVNISTDGRALPLLAESWAWEAEGRRLRLKLRPDVTFHDGTPLSSTVVSDALQRALDQPESQAFYPSLSSIIAVRPEGDLELVLELSEPSAFLPEELELPIAIGPGLAIGTGPFRLVSREPSSVVLERFDGYHLGAPQVERIVVRPFNTLRIAWTSLLRAEVDMVTDVPPEALDFVRNDAIQVVPFARSFQFLIAFNSRTPPFTSAAIRRALNVAVDRQALIAQRASRTGAAVDRTDLAQALGLRCDGAAVQLRPRVCGRAAGRRRVPKRNGGGHRHAPARAPPVHLPGARGLCAARAHGP